MSTRSMIAKQLPSGGYKAVYCHYDGYPQAPGVGWILKKDYNDYKKVDELLALGDISALKRDIGKKHDFDDNILYSSKGWTNVYHRDRGEIWENVATKLFKDLASLKSYARGANAEWLYIYKHKKTKKDTPALNWSDNYWIKDNEDGNWETIKIDWGEIE